MLVAFARLIEFDLFLHTRPRRVEPLVIERFEQVVEGVYFKGTNGILIVKAVTKMM